MDERHRRHLDRCVELATMALESGHAPFGSVLVSGDGRVLAEDHNRTGDGDPVAHPEIALARWAVAHLTPSERAQASVYTSGEHCPMCSAAHAWSGLGPIVFAASGAQLDAWYKEVGIAPAPVASLPIATVAPSTVTEGPYDHYVGTMRALHHRWAQRVVEA